MKRLFSILSIIVMFFGGLGSLPFVSAVGCTEELKECPDGINVARNPARNCEFDPCPSKVPACPADARICPDGTAVGRDPYNNCEFPACPSENQCGTCKREYDECMTQEMVGIEKVCEPKYKECLNKCQNLPVEQKCSSGCFSASNNRCVSIGFRLKENDASMYCDIDGMLKQQKSDGSQASNSYECLGNFQSDGKCVSVSENLNILQRILKWFSKIFGGN